ncbi:MAG: LysR family transcriptional regulator [Kofleriaceae bacterium]
MDRFEAFSAFASVADTGGFAAAARQLGRSPAAVTRTIAALEAELGTQLFRRTTRVVNLTDAGTRFLVSVRRILADVAEASAAAASDATLAGTLVVTAPVMFGRVHVAPVLLRFLAKHPDVRARALLADRVVDLVEEAVDVAIRIANLGDSSLRAVRVGEVRRVTCASPAYLSEHGTPRTPADLRDHAVIAFSAGAPPREWTYPQPRRTGRVRIAPQLTTNSVETTIAAALAGHGVTRALSYQVAGDVRSGKLVIVLADHEPQPVPIHIVHAGGTARIRAFVDFAVAGLRAALD